MIVELRVRTRLEKPELDARKSEIRDELFNGSKFMESVDDVDDNEVLARLEGNAPQVFFEVAFPTDANTLEILEPFVTAVAELKRRSAP